MSPVIALAKARSEPPPARTTAGSGWRRLFRALGCCVLLLAQAAPLRAQQAGSVDPSFGASLGLAGRVRQTLVQKDGKILVVGSFLKGIVRLNADGSMDTSFDSGAGASGFGVSALAVQADGKIILGGLFDSVGGVKRNSIARLNPDGSLDSGFDPGAGANSEVFALATLASGKVALAGNFNAVGSAVRNYVALLSGDGSLDPGFVPGVGVPNIAALVLQPDDGKVLVGGDLSDIGGVPVNALARLNADGSLDDSFAAEFLPGDSVQALALQPDDGDVLAAALVPDDSAAAQPAAFNNAVAWAAHRPRALSKVRNVIHRCHKADGKFDPAFNAFTDGTTLAVAGLPGRTALIAGSFSLVNGQAYAKLARLNADGSPDASFLGSADGTVRALSVRAANGGIFLGGDFGSVNGVPRVRVARLRADGSLDAGFDPGAGRRGCSATMTQAAAARRWQR